MIELSLEDLFNAEADDIVVQEDPKDQEDPKGKEYTKEVAERIKSEKEKAEQAGMEKAAKSAGYESYAEMQKAIEKKTISDSGLDADAVGKLVDELLTRRLNEDASLKRLKDIERQTYLNKEYEEIYKLTGVKINDVSELSKEAIDLWGKGVDLSRAYIATLPSLSTLPTLATPDKISLRHLATPGGNVPLKTRSLTAEERAMWRACIPSITDEELNKKTVEITTTTKI